jgi:hypothetical protein
VSSEFNHASVSLITFGEFNHVYGELTSSEFNHVCEFNHA